MRSFMYFAQSSMASLPSLPPQRCCSVYLKETPLTLLGVRAGWRLKFEDTYFVPLLISLLSGEALLNQIFYIPTPLTQKPSIFQDALTHPPFFTKPTPLSCNCPHHRHHHFSCSLADLPQLDAATLGFSTQEPQNCVLPETSTRIRDLSPEDIPLRSRLL